MFFGLLPIDNLNFGWTLIVILPMAPLTASRTWKFLLKLVEPGLALFRKLRFSKELSCLIHLRPALFCNGHHGHCFLVLGLQFVTETSFSSRICSPSSSSSWAEYAPDCSRGKGKPARKNARSKNRCEHCVSQWLVLVSILGRHIGLSQEQVCLNQRIHLSRHCLEASQQNVEPCVVIPDFLTWPSLKIIDEIVHNPASSKYLNRLEMCPQVIKQILNTIWCFQVLYSSHESKARASSRSNSFPALFSSATRVLDTKRRTRLSHCRKSASSNVGISSARPSPYCRGSLLVTSTSEFHCGKSWFDQGACRFHWCHVHSA